MRQAVFICGLFGTDIWWKKRKNWTHGHKGRKNSNSTLAMKHGQTHPKFWFWYCTVCISMAGPCRADTTNPARGWIYENIAHKIMEMSALITHTIQFFFYLHRRSFGREAVRNSTFPWKNWPQVFFKQETQVRFYYSVNGFLHGFNLFVCSFSIQFVMFVLFCFKIFFWNSRF